MFPPIKTALRIAFVGGVVLGAQGASAAPKPPPGGASIRAEPPSFSPNGDGRRDSTVLTIRAESLADAGGWDLRIRGKWNRTVMRLRGAPPVPAQWEWDGRRSDGTIVPPGVYKAKLVLKSVPGRRRSDQTAIVVDVVPPRAELSLSTPAFSPDGDGRNDAVVFSLKGADDRAVESWAMRVSPMVRRTVLREETGTFDSGRAEWAWDGRIADGEAPTGRYNIFATVSDAAGNETILAPLSFELVLAPDEALRRASDLGVQTSADGLSVSLRENALFDEDGELTRASRPLRRHLADLINAWPDAKVLVSARATGGKDAADQAARRAWTLYIDLVESGVSPARFEIDGRSSDGGADEIVIRLIHPAEELPQ